VFYDVLKLFH